MFNLRACPRCGGDLHTERDHYGAYTYCVQCGHELPYGAVERAADDAERAAMLRRVRESFIHG